MQPEAPLLAEMAIVPAGEFPMGTGYLESLGAESLDSRVGEVQLSEEQPQHAVYLDTYAIGIHPVTVAEYRRFCEATGNAMPKPPNWGWFDDHPVVKVNWFEATAFCEWAGKRLPTEAEWEKAAGGADGRLFPWGNGWDVNAGHCDCHHHCQWSGSTAPVGTHPAGVSPYGCHDMIGQVWEWCADWADPDYYRDSPRENPRWPAEGWSRILRGGSWKSNCLEDLRFTDRSWSYPDVRNEAVGFRCAGEVE
jgi:formylglycine-generating enzyme required for sulfatase activity